MPWIDHPATQDGHVSIRRWLKYHIGEWMQYKGGRWVDEALHPDRCKVCGAAKMPGFECDHIPF